MDKNRAGTERGQEKTGTGEDTARQTEEDRNQRGQEHQMKGPELDQDRTTQDMRRKRQDETAEQQIRARLQSSSCLLNPLLIIYIFHLVCIIRFSDVSILQQRNII